MANKFKTVPLDKMIDKHIGKRGTEKREMFENELRIELLGQAIKQARQERKAEGKMPCPLDLFYRFQHIPQNLREELTTSRNALTLVKVCDLWDDTISCWFSPWCPYSN